MNNRRRKFLGFALAKNFTVSKLPISKPTFYLVTPRTFRLDESIKTAQIYFYCEAQMYILDCQQIWKINYIPSRSTHKNI